MLKKYWNEKRTHILKKKKKTKAHDAQDIYLKKCFQVVSAQKPFLCFNIILDAEEYEIHCSTQRIWHVTVEAPWEKQGYLKQQGLVGQSYHFFTWVNFLGLQDKFDSVQMHDKGTNNEA